IGAVFLGSALLAACEREDGPLSPGPETAPELETVQATFVCHADLKTESIGCVPQTPALPDGTSGALIGGQGTYIHLEAANVSYDAGNERFSAVVTVRNLLTQPLGTSDGETVDGEGIRVFFVELPVATEGSGVV